MTEYGLINDTLIQLQMNNAVRNGVAQQYGFDESNYTSSSGGTTETITNSMRVIIKTQTKL